MNYPTNYIRYLATFAALAAAGTSVAIAAASPKPLKALLIAGGCCHDYATQKEILKKGIEERAYVTVDIVYAPDTSTKTRFDVYEKPDWAKGYDVIIHDECSADVKDLPYVEAVLAAHKSGVPAVNLHCAMHCYRTGTDDWFKFIGIQSTGHGPQKPIDVSFLEPRHAITTGLSNWTTGDEELYNNIKLFPTATPLARGTQITQARDGTKRTNDYVVVWANDYSGTRVFNSTLGHNNTLVSDARYLDLVARGLLWACGQLNDIYLKTQKKAEVDAASKTAEYAKELPDTRLPTPEELAAEKSLMPEGLAAQLGVKEFSSLIDDLQQLAVSGQ